MSKRHLFFFRKMAPKLGFLIVDDRYSKSRIGSLLFGMFSVAILIWLIVLTIKKENITKGM